MDIVVRVPKKEVGHFWEDVPDDAIEWWTLGRYPRHFRAGERIWFAIGDQIVATAKCREIRQGRLNCDATDRMWNGCHIMWAAMTFRKLDPPLPLGDLKVPRGFAYIDTSDWGHVITPEHAEVHRRSATER